jgi:hypothetical protein
MQRSGWIGSGIRAVWTVGAPMAALVVLASGCQLIAGTFTAGTEDKADASDADDGLGPICKKLAACCSSLDNSEGSVCLSAVQKENEDLCAATMTGLPAGACMTTPGSDGGTRPDGVAPQGDAKTPDGPVQHDAPGSKDVIGPMDVVPTDVSSDADVDLDGTWALNEVTCDGSALDVGGTTLTLTFTTGALDEVETLSDGCVITTDFQFVTISDTTVSSTQGSTTCGTACTTSDDCTAGTFGASDFSYTLSSGTLGISESADTTECSSGTIILDFTM